MLPSISLSPRRVTPARRALVSLLMLLALVPGCAHDRRSIGSMVDDAAIELKATGTLTTNPAFKDQVHVNVTSVNGIVLLTGEVPTGELRDSLLASIRNILSIRRIVNEVRVAPPSTLSRRTHDAWITSEVKARLVGTKGVHAARIKVVTENSSVFLLGLVSQQEGELATNAATAVRGIERVVKLFEYVE
jgi:osmotically-inducible protein OsmY